MGVGRIHNGLMGSRSAALGVFRFGVLIRQDQICVLECAIFGRGCQHVKHYHLSLIFRGVELSIYLTIHWLVMSTVLSLDLFLASTDAAVSACATAFDIETSDHIGLCSRLSLR